jgi:hypothetical protein
MLQEHHHHYDLPPEIQPFLAARRIWTTPSCQLKSKRSISFLASRACIKHMGLLLWSCISCLLRSGLGQSAVGSIVCQRACLCSKLAKTDMKLPPFQRRQLKYQRFIRTYATNILVSRLGCFEATNLQSLHFTRLLSCHRVRGNSLKDSVISFGHG